MHQSAIITKMMAITTAARPIHVGIESHIADFTIT
jgi:hypothetical protein